MVGLDLVYSTPRFTFGNFDLMSGLTFIPVLIGLFAIPEIINFYTKGETKLEHGKLAGIGATWADFKSLPQVDHPWQFHRCGAWRHPGHRRRAVGFPVLQ